MFNTLKAGYLVARRLAFDAIEDRRKPDTGFYTDTLDYALYGTQPATLLLAQRAALDVLDQIAVALNEYLSVGLAAHVVNYSAFWREKDAPIWRPQLLDEIAKGNYALIALGELAEDLSAEGFLHRKRQARNASTHRFTVLHDMVTDAWRASPAVRHEQLEKFQGETLETLQAVRGAILYFVEAMVLREHRHHDPGRFVGSLYLPSHHWIRGRR
jgi:hypothetical protein